MKKALYWLPRILAAAYLFFISVFALDSFQAGVSVKALIAFFMHLFPGFIVALALVLAWSDELWGGITFLVVGIFFAYYFRNGQAFLPISIPLFLVGILFLINFKFKAPAFNIEENEGEYKIDNKENFK